MIRSHSSGIPASQGPQAGDTPRGAHDSTGSMTTRWPIRRSPTSSSRSATTSWPGTNGMETRAEK